jgi:hypothetical protein
MVDVYKKESALLYQTGGGVEPENTGDDGANHDQRAGVGLEEDAEGVVTMNGRRLPYYIPPDGPTVSTGSDAVNLWGKRRVPCFLHAKFTVTQIKFVAVLDGSPDFTSSCAHART